MDPEGLRMDSRKSRNRGFDGRLIAHPLEIKPVQEGYSIDYIEYLDAKEILKQYYQSEKGVLYIDGKVIGPPHVKRYERIIEKYETQK
jgi:citrate lyase beta subunit